MVDKEKQRLEYLDMARGIAIVSVIMGHILSKNFLKIWLCSFHVVLFFIISGCLLNYTNGLNKSIKSFIIGRAKTIILPYFIFSIIYIVSNLFILGFNIESLKWNIIYTFILYGVGALWFLPALFISEIALLLLYKIFKNKITIILSIALLVIISFVISNYNIIMLIIARSFIGLGFITVGYYCFEYLKELNLNKMILISMLILSVLFSQINGIVVDLWQLQFNNIFLYLSSSILGSFSIILILKGVNSGKIFTYCGINSLILMCTHQNIMEGIKQISGYSFNNIVYGIILLVIILLIEVPIIYVINNYLPCMLGKFKKKEKYMKEVSITQD